MAEGEILLQDRDWRRRNSMWVLPTLLCCGVFTWASFLYVGVRARRLSWLVAAALYGVAFVLYFLLIDAAPRATDGTSHTTGWQSTIGTLLFLAVWIGGAVHALAINRQWLTCLATPRDLTPASWFSPTPTIAPGTLEEPWRSFVSQALTLQKEIVATVASTAPGPMQDRLQGVADHVETGLTECWQIAQGGQRLTRARGRIDTAAIAQQLSRLQPVEANPSLTQVAQALQAQLDTAKRIEDEVSSTNQALVLLNARLGEVAARAIELSARPHALKDAAAVDGVIESVVNELVAIRQGLTEMDQYPPGG